MGRRVTMVWPMELSICNRKSRPIAISNVTLTQRIASRIGGLHTRRPVRRP